MNENFNDTEFCSVCGGTFKGARSHRDKPYKTCKTCLDREDLRGNMSKDLIDRIDRMSNDHMSDNGLENESIINKFDEVKGYLSEILDIDIVCETKEMKNYFTSTFYNVAFNNTLAQKISSINEDFIINSSDNQELVISIRK